MVKKHYVIDRRNLYIIILNKLYKPVIFFILLFLLGIWHRYTAFTGLSSSAHDALGIFFLCVILWVTGIIPPAITGFVGIALLIVSKALTPEEVFPMFFSEPVFFIFSAFALAAGIRKTGLAKRIAAKFISINIKLKVRSRLYIMSAFLSMLIPEHAVAAMILPIVFETDAGFTKGDIISVMWGTQIGGIATLLGGARGPLAIAMLNAIKGTDISFLQWSIYAFPVFLIMFVAGYLLLNLFFREDNRNAVRMEKHSGVIKFDEIMMLLILILTTIGWVKYGVSVGLAGIGLIAVIVLFVFGILKVEDLTRRIDWAVILMYGGAISVGLALQKTGAITWIISQGSSILSYPMIAVMLLFLIAVVLTEFVSHSTVVAALLPVAIGISGTVGFSPKIMAIGVALASGMAFILPYGSPGNLIAYSSGAVKLKNLALPGFIMICVSVFALFLAVKYYWPFLLYKNI